MDGQDPAAKDQKPAGRIFGGSGAGVLVLARDTGRLLALKRSDHVQHGRTWGLSGGLLETGETPAQAAAREFREETEYKGADFDLIPLAVFKTGDFTYSNFLAVVEHEFRPSIDHENEAYQWVDDIASWPEPRHFGIGFIAGDAASMEIVRAEQAACGRAPAAAAAPQYPPTLYHVFRGDEAAPQVTPAPGRAEIRATENLREALPRLIPREHRIATLPLPGSEDFIVVLPEREKFLAEGKLDGVIFQLPGDGFSAEKKEGRPLRWVKQGTVPVSDRNYFDHVAKLDAAMYYGLHILFTNGPLDEAERAKIDKAVTAPDATAALRRLVGEGLLVYENARRGIRVSPLLQPDNAPPPPKGPDPRSLIKFGKQHRG